MSWSFKGRMVKILLHILQKMEAALSQKKEGNTDSVFNYILLERISQKDFPIGISSLRYI